nr:MAG TPA: hypothetical protein [Caudoviricetes sp.]
MKAWWAGTRVPGHPPTGRTRLADHLPDSLTVVFGWPLP